MSIALASAKALNADNDDPYMILVNTFMISQCSFFIFLHLARKSSETSRPSPRIPNIAIASVRLSAVSNAWKKNMSLRPPIFRTASAASLTDLSEKSVGIKILFKAQELVVPKLQYHYKRKLSVRLESDLNEIKKR